MQVYNAHGIWKTWVQSLGWEVPLEASMVTHSSILENPHGERRLVGYSPWGRRELDITEQLSAAFST